MTTTITTANGQPSVDKNLIHKKFQTTLSKYPYSVEEQMGSLQRETTTTASFVSRASSRISRNKITVTSTLPTSPDITGVSVSSPSSEKAGWKRKLRKGILMNAGSGNSARITTDSKYDNGVSGALGADTGNWKGSSFRWNYITRHFQTSTTTPVTAASNWTAAAATALTSGKRRISKNNAQQQQALSVQQLPPLLARSVRTTLNTTGGGEAEGMLRGKRRTSGSSSSRTSSSVLTAKEEFSIASSSGVGLRLMMAATAAPETVGGESGRSNGEISRSSGMHSPSSVLGPGERDNNYIVGGDDVVDVGVSRRLLDIHQISSHLHRSFPWEGLGLHHNSSISAGSIGHSITSRIGFNPATTPHTLIFSSLYIVPLILFLGIAVGLIWLVCACTYHTMKRIKFALCPGRARGGSSKKGKNSNDAAASSKSSGGLEDGNSKPEILTPEILEMRRQERLAFLQAECANLEQQLTDEKNTTLTSRASDSDLEYLGASESPPLKRNSISLQDIPQSVIRIRREKELRQIKEEIEYLRSIAQQEKEKVAQVAKALKGSLLITQEFELPGSKPGSPSDTKVEPLSQHISHLKTQRKLNEIRSELEDLAIQLLHADEIKAKRSSLQELPRTALNIQREQNIITMTNEIQKIKNYKLQKKNVIETALEKTSVNPKGASGGGADKTGSKSFNPSNKSPSTTQDVAAKYSDPEFVRGASIRRQREQELNRVRVELKDLAYKLNLNPMNYISEDRVRLVPSQSMQSTSSVAGHSSSYNKSTSSASALNHV